MQGDYPCFKTTYTHEELVEHFLLSPVERAVVETCREDANRHGVAVLLKAVQYLGYFPHEFQHVPEVVRTFIAHQLQLFGPSEQVFRNRHRISVNIFRIRVLDPTLSSP